MPVEVHRLKVELEIEIEAFEASDAMDLAEEYFGGEGLGSIAIVKSKITPLDGPE